jgi:hypothetical protein
MQPEISDLPSVRCHRDVREILQDFARLGREGVGNGRRCIHVTHIFCGSGGRRAISCLLQIRKGPRRSELNYSWEEAQIQFSGRRELEILIRSVLEPHFRSRSGKPAREQERADHADPSVRFEVPSSP